MTAEETDTQTTSDALAPKPASEHTRRYNTEAATRLPMTDRRDFDDADRGFVATVDDTAIRGESGRPIIDYDTRAFITDDVPAPDSVHPSLWRHAQVDRRHGLYEVVPHVYQVRGFDLANMTIVEGDEGIIVIDPISFTETASAALALYREHRGNRPVRAMIYTHSHGDHFGGSRAVVGEGVPDVPVIAPAGLLAEAASEDVFAGTAMIRRGFYMYGPALPPGPRGSVDAGLSSILGIGGSSTLVPPNDSIEHTGERRTIDGVEMVFQMAQGTEAPAEFLIHFPGLRVLCAAEDATPTLHNLYTLRGAQIRDAAAWWKVLNESIELFADDSDVVIAQHGWPRWGSADVRVYLENQRDAYKYVHDEALRLANKGETMTEIAEDIDLPASLQREWYTHGYYGSVNHNAKAVYQRYLGWYDSHPAHLHPLPPTEAGRRYVEFMGGPDTVLEKAHAAFDAGDYRWVAEVLTHLVFADPGNTAARHLQADTLEQLGYQSENATWRNEYLMAALELRHGVRDLGSIDVATADVFAAMTPEMIFDFAGIKLDGAAAANTTLTLEWTVRDAPDSPTFLLELRNGVLVYTAGKSGTTTDARASSTKSALARALFLGADLDALQSSGDLTIDTPAPVERLFSLFDEFHTWFPIVEP